jgi:NAD-dependent SIR2 family protein deacetylase
MAAYSLFPKYAPNTAHKAIFELERRGHVKFLITQNVDGLHIKAGSHDVLELHGHLRDVKCMSCHDVIARKDWQDLLAGNNPKFQEKVLEKKWQNPESMYVLLHEVYNIASELSPQGSARR